MTRAFIDLMPSLEMTGPPEWVISNSHTGLKRLPGAFYRWLEDSAA